MKYLDQNGLLYTWSKTKAYVEASVTAAAAAKGDNLTYANKTLTLRSGATVLSNVTIDTGVQSYTDLSNKPSINGVSLVGDKTTSDLGINLPTKVSELTNDSTYQTSIQVSNAIATAIAGVTQFDFKIVAELPSTGVKGTIYLVSTGSTEQRNIYVEYIWVDNKFERFGPEIDLSGYVKFSDLVVITNAEIDAICV